MEDFQPEVRKAIRDNSLVWVDQRMIDTAYAFVGEGDLDYPSKTVRFSEDGG